MGPSAVPSPLYNEVPKAMDADDIERVTEGWARSAELSREGGFDGVEVHLAHAYLLHQFLSPLYNHRTDEYGGSLSNRLRFAESVITRVRRRVGEDYSVSVRISLTDIVDGGMTIDDAVEITRQLLAAGSVSLITVTAGGCHDGLYNAIATSDRDDGWLIEPTARVKQAAGEIPVCVVGGIQNPAQAEQVLAAGNADMTRAQIADPEWANKVLSGREAELRRCIRSNQGCISRSFRGFPIGCTVNPAAGREALLGSGTLVPASPPRRWLVVGGGPAGMKAAEVLARRGHRVSLWERSGQLGGQVTLLARSPGRARFGYVIDDLQRSLQRLGVDVRLGVEATADLVVADRPDAVVVATGAEPDDSGFSSITPLGPRIPRADGADVLTGWDVLDGTRQPRGRYVLLLDDLGNRYSAGVAETLLDQGFDVEFVTRLPSLLPALATTLDLGEMYTRLATKGMRYQVNQWPARSTPTPSGSSTSSPSRRAPHSPCLRSSWRPAHGRTRARTPSCQARWPQFT